MVQVYRSEVKPRARLLLLTLATPFVLVVTFGLVGFFDPFGADARALVSGILRGDFTRIDDFLAYLVLVLILFGIPGGLIFAIVSTAIFKRDQTVTLNPQDQIVTLRLKLPFSAATQATYAFGDVRIELKRKRETLIEQGEIWLRLPDRRKPIVLVAIFNTLDCHAEYQNLRAMGLIGKAEPHPMA